MNDSTTDAVISPPGRGIHVLGFDTAWGRCFLTYASRPFSVFSITLPGRTTGNHPVAKEESKAAHPLVIRVGQAITAYFNGHKPPAIPEDWLSLDRLTSNERRVLDVVRHIPYGATRTYAEVAEMAGFPGGARFAGNALHKNPFPVIIPCHRVIRSNGAIGGFASGSEMKQRMLALEAANTD